MYQLKIIVASTRPQRKGIHVARWFFNEAQQYDGFEVEMLDLAEINLPMLDEPHHPRLQKYTKEHTIAWSKQIASADAFVIVIPEYNHFAPASLINALDFLFDEWSHKPVGLVSYGGVSGGLRSAQSLKPLLTALKMVPLPAAVALPNFAKRIDEDGHFKADELIEKSVSTMMEQLLHWTKGLKNMREQAS